MTSTLIAETVEVPALEDEERPRGRWFRRGLLVAIAVLLAFGFLAFLAIRYDRSHRDELLPGVIIGSVAAGDRDADAIVSRFEGRLTELGREEVRIAAGPTQTSLTLAQMGLRSDADDAVAKARAKAEEMGLISRLSHRLRDKPVRQSYPVSYHVDRAAIRKGLGELAAEVERAPVDAKIDTSTGLVRIIPAVEGRGLDIDRATALTFDLGEKRANGLSSESEVRAPLLTKKPNITGYDDVILVRTAENKLYHYENGNLSRTYTVATGLAQYPTPKGNFKIVLKRRLPTWVNPDPGGWGKSLPKSIPPGPNNPLGTRALNLNSPGIRIHGTSNVRSLGTAASHGCIRMAMPDVEALFEKVDVNTPVIIIQGPPPVAPPPPPPPGSTIGDPNAPIDLEGGG